jgi:hypothetical protein
MVCYMKDITVYGLFKVIQNVKEFIKIQIELNETFQK